MRLIMLLILTCASKLWEFLPKANKQISMYQHDKGPMDGVGASIKNEIDNAINFNMCTWVMGVLTKGQ